MNIVHLQLSGGIGGISVLTRDLAKISENNNIFYFLFEGGVIADDMEKNGSLVHIEDGRHFDFIGEARKFTKFCKKNNADVIIAHSGSPICRFLGLYAKKHMKNTKFFVYFHSNALDTSYKNKIKYYIDAFIEKSAFKACDYGIAISKSVKDSFIKKYNLDKNKIKVVYNGIECNKFYSERLDADDNKLNIIYVGRIFASKGIHILIDAINLLPHDINISVKLVGRDHDGYTEMMKERVNKLKLNDKIEFTGARLDVPELLAQSDVFIHPAIWREGFGISMAEAMAAYLPCIAFNKGAIPEIIDNKINGFIVDTVDARHLADAIKKVYDIHNTEEYKAMRLNARQKAETFSIEKLTLQLERIYTLNE